MPVDTADGEKQIDVPAFAAAVRRVLADPTYRASARRVAESMRTYGGAQEAANRIERLVRVSLTKESLKAMGNFYVNYTLRGPSQQAVAAALAGRSAIVTPVQDGSIVAFDEASDDQDQGIIAGLASSLSQKLAVRCWPSSITTMTFSGISSI